MSVIIRKLSKSRGGRAGMVAGGVVGDLVGFLATVYFSAELLQAAEAAGVSGLLPR